MNDKLSERNVLDDNEFIVPVLLRLLDSVLKTWT